MAKLDEILKCEAERQTPESFNDIHLFQEGSFLRAYELSAWLCSRFIHAFSPTKRLHKASNKEFVFVGFPLTSLDKWTPECAVCTEVEDKHRVIRLNQLLDDASIERIGVEYLEWKGLIPLSVGRKEENSAGTSNMLSNPNNINDLLHVILEYPIEQKSLLDNVVFLSNVREQLRKLLR